MPEEAPAIDRTIEGLLLLAAYSRLRQGLTAVRQRPRYDMEAKEAGGAVPEDTEAPAGRDPAVELTGLLLTLAFFDAL